MNDFNNGVNNNSNFNVYNDSLLLEGEKRKKKYLFTDNKIIVIIAICLAIFIVLFLVYNYLVKPLFTYTFDNEIPSTLYIGESAEIKTSFEGRQTNKFSSVYSLDNDYTMFLLKDKIDSLNGNNVIIPIQEGVNRLSVTGVFNADKASEKVITSKKYSIFVCPSFDLSLFPFHGISLTKGSVYNLDIDYGEGDCSKDINYKSTNNTVMSVNSSGVITGLSSGTANLVVNKGGKNIVVPVYVTNSNISLTAIKSKVSKYQLSSGEKFRMEFSIAPFNTTSFDIKYASSDNSVATVNKYGVVEAQGAGTAKIRAMSNNPLLAAEVEVIVEDPSAKVVPAIKIEVSDKLLNMEKGQSKKIHSIVTPDEALNSLSKWESSNNSVAVVNSVGVIYARDSGDAIITVKNGDIKETIKVNVK